MMRGRIAPTPSGLLHLGHAATFLEAARQCRNADGTLILRIEDLDPLRCKSEFTTAAIDDLRWLGIDWSEGPDVGGPHWPYIQSERRNVHGDAWQQLKDGGWIYPCRRTRKDVAAAAGAPHPGTESIFPKAWRPSPTAADRYDHTGDVNWRFRVPDGETIFFTDGRCGMFQAIAGADFGDFLVWRRDGVPAYELAVVADDIAMQITDVVRGEDLLLSTCRQLLIYRALGATPPSFFHTRLVLDAMGQRLAKRDRVMSLRTLRDLGTRPEEIPTLAQ